MTNRQTDKRTDRAIGSLRINWNIYFVGCYEKQFTYVDNQTNAQIPISQIQSLIALSEYCEQSFYYEYTLAPLTVTNFDGEIDYAYWEDRHGGINNYFTGTDPVTNIFK